MKRSATYSCLSMSGSQYLVKLWSFFLCSHRKEKIRNVMNEVRASVCSASALSTTSKYPGSLLVGRSTESPGFTDGYEGSNTSVFAMGVVVREASGVTRFDFALYRGWGGRRFYNCSATEQGVAELTLLPSIGTILPSQFSCLQASHLAPLQPSR